MRSRRRAAWRVCFLGRVPPSTRLHKYCIASKWTGVLRLPILGDRDALLTPTRRRTPDIFVYSCALFRTLTFPLNQKGLVSRESRRVAITRIAQASGVIALALSGSQRGGFRRGEF